MWVPFVLAPPGAKFKPCTATLVPAPDTANEGIAAANFLPNPKDSCVPLGDAEGNNAAKVATNSHTAMARALVILPRRVGFFAKLISGTRRECHVNVSFYGSSPFTSRVVARKA